jgi:predicted Zn-dependent protease
MIFRTSQRRGALGHALTRGALGACAAALAFTPPLSAYAQADSDQVSIIRDAEVEEILHADADPIFIAAGLDPKAVQIHVVGNKELNAFASGGQQIFLFTGLIMETETPNQLQGVIAHETGHVAGGHLARMDTGNKNAIRTFLLTVGLGVAAAMAGAPDLGGGLIGSSGYFATLNILGYTRVQEAQADQAAVTYLEKANLSGRGMVDFFNNFRYEEVFSGAARYPYFQSHPLSSERIEALRVRVEKLPHVAAVDSPEAIAKHKLMVAKLKAFINFPQQTLQEYKESDTSFPARYARAIAYYKATDVTRSLNAIDALLKEQPNDPYLWELRGQVLFESGKAAEAEPAHRKALELKPDQPLLQFNLGQALLAQNTPAKTDEAVALLRKCVGAEHDNALAWRLLAQGYDATNQPGMARLATAEMNFALGSSTQARIFGMRAREALPKDSPEWRRATDIVLVSDPSKADLAKLAEEGSTNPVSKPR